MNVLNIFLVLLYIDPDYNPNNEQRKFLAWQRYTLAPDHVYMHTNSSLTYTCMHAHAHTHKPYASTLACVFYAAWDNLRIDVYGFAAFCEWFF